MRECRIAIAALLAVLLLGDGASAWAGDDSGGGRVERVLAAGQIDSSTVDVGTFTVVIYGQGERQPVSGAWTKLDTLPVRPDDKAGRRIALKLLSGTLIGSLSGYTLGKILAHGSSTKWFTRFYFQFGGVIGSVYGTTVGVSLVDLHAPFRTFIGSLLGIPVGLMAAKVNLWLFPVGPIAMATLASEVSRDYDLLPFILMSREARLFSVGVVPNPRESLSVIATLRF